MVFFIALLAGGMVLLARCLKRRPLPDWKFMPAGALLGMLNFGSTYYLLMAMAAFETSVLFPVINMGIVILSVIFGFVFFREKPGRINWVGIVLAIMAIFLITAGT